MRNLSCFVALFACLYLLSFTGPDPRAEHPLFPELTLPDTSQACPAPSDISILSITDSSATIAWISSDSIMQTNLTLTLPGGAELEIEDVFSPLIVDGLEACSAYEVRLMSVCAAGASAARSISLSTVGEDCCSAPLLTFETIGDTFAIARWDTTLTADAYVVRFKRPKDTVWAELSTSGGTVSIDNLAPCKSYEVQIKARCATDSTGFSASYLLQTDGCGICTNFTYCESRGFDATETFIDSISIGAFRMQSGENDGYFAYTADPGALERERNYKVFVQPGFGPESDTCPVYIRVWLDLNQDGVFTDSTEILLDQIDAEGSGRSATFSTAFDLPLGITRLRVSLTPVIDTLPPAACGNFNFGEVEDYCIRIDDLCPFAAELDTMDVSQESATIGWEGNPKAVGFIYRYREVGNNNWEDEMITMDTVVTLDGLSKCTDYEFELTTVCIQDTTKQILEFSTVCPSAVEELPGFVEVMTVFPNPTRGVFTLELRTDRTLTGNIRIVDLMGRMVYAEVIPLVQGQLLVKQFDVLQHVPSGMYLLIVEADRQTAVTRLVNL